MNEGESYRDVTGQLPDTNQKAIGKRKIQEVRKVLDETVCNRCAHGNRYHDPVCRHPVGQAGTDCECPGPRTNESENP